MLNRLFGNYLVEKEIISIDKLNSFFPIDKDFKADISTIAVIRKMLSATQVSAIASNYNLEQERFSDITVSNEILLESDIDKLISLQGNKFCKFVQLLINSGCLALENINPLIESFQKDRGYSNEEYESFFVDDLEQILNFLAPVEDQHIKLMILTMMRTFRRLIDANVYIDRSYSDTSVELDAYSGQLLSGDFNAKLYFTGDGNNLLGIANYFTSAKYDEVCEDALDNIGEFINCINGQLATDLSYEDINVDMGAPEYSMDKSSITGRCYYIVPLHANGYSFRAVIDVTL